MFDEITTFSFPTRIAFGCGAVRRLPEYLQENGVRKALVVTDVGRDHRRLAVGTVDQRSGEGTEQERGQGPRHQHRSSGGGGGG